jgi:hypothetical protein
MRCRVTLLIKLCALMTDFKTEMRKMIVAVGGMLTTPSSFQSMRYW